MVSAATAGRRGEVRVYPSCCTSAYCGRGDCRVPNVCRNLPTLNAFNAWREATDAVADDPVWYPTVYTARRDAPTKETRK